MSVPDRIHLAYKNYLKEFTLLSDIAPYSAYPLTNLQVTTPNKWAIFDMTSQTEITFSWTGSTDYTVNSLVLQGHNLPSDATVQILLYPNAGYTGTEYDSGDLPVKHTIPWGAFMAGEPFGGYFEETGNLKQIFSHIFDEFTFKSGKVVIKSAAFTDDQLSIDKLWCVPAYCFDHNPEYGLRFPLQDNSFHIDKPGGGVATVEREAYRSCFLDFRGVQDTEAILVQHMLEKAKLSGDLFISMDPNNTLGRKYYQAGIFKRNNIPDFTMDYYNGNSLMFAGREN